jgi:hypothetical protein
MTKGTERPSTQRLTFQQSPQQRGETGCAAITTGSGVCGLGNVNATVASVGCICGLVETISPVQHLSPFEQKLEQLFCGRCEYTEKSRTKKKGGGAYFSFGCFPDLNWNGGTFASI